MLELKTLSRKRHPVSNIVVFLSSLTFVSRSRPVPHHPGHAALDHDFPATLDDPRVLLVTLRLVIRGQGLGDPGILGSLALLRKNNKKNFFNSPYNIFNLFLKKYPQIR